MKKIILVIFIFGFNLTVFAQSGNTTNSNNNSSSPEWKSHTQCEKNEKPVANSNGAFSTTFKIERTTSTQNQGTQNHYSAGYNSTGVSRDGERTTNTSGSKTEESHTVKYDCVPANETRKVVPRPTQK